MTPVDTGERRQGAQEEATVARQNIAILYFSALMVNLVGQLTSRQVIFSILPTDMMLSAWCERKLLSYTGSPKKVSYRIDDVQYLPSHPAILATTWYHSSCLESLYEDFVSIALPVIGFFSGGAKINDKHLLHRHVCTTSNCHAWFCNSPDLKDIGLHQFSQSLLLGHPVMVVNNDYRANLARCPTLEEEVATTTSSSK